MFTAKKFSDLTLEELNAIYIARSRVFTVGQQLTVQEPDLVDRKAVHFFSQNDAGEVVAYMRLIDLEKVEDDHYEQVSGAYALSRVAVLKTLRGQGMGRKLLDAAIQWVRDETEATKIIIDAQAYLRDSYYAPVGFVQVGEEFREAGLPHVKMILEL